MLRAASMLPILNSLLNKESLRQSLCYLTNFSCNGNVIYSSEIQMQILRGCI